MKIAVCPGSFDPVTYGHLDIIERASLLFDRLYVAVLTNPVKEPLFTVEDRLDMLERATSHIGNVVCEHFTGLVVDYAKKVGASAIVRGLRAVSDFEFEFKLASMNRHLSPEIETIFMMTSNEYSFLSSSAVKEVASFGGDVSQWVSEDVARRLRARYAALRGNSSFPGANRGQDL